MPTRRTGEIEQIRIYAVDGDSNPLTGLSDLYIRLERASDGFLYDWNDSTWKSTGWTTLSQALSELDATNLPGVYELTGGFDPTAATNENASDVYTVYPLQTPGTNARLPGPGAFRVGYWVDEIFADLPDDVADQVWEEALADHSGTSGSTAEALDAAATGTVPTPAEIADAVWDEVASGHVTSGSMGELQNNCDADVSSRAVPGDAMDLVADAVDASAVAATGAAEIRDAILSDSTPFPGAYIDAAISGRAVPGDAMDLVTNALDADAVATTGASEIRDAILSDSTPFQGARIDAAITSRAAPGAAMDLIGNALDASALDATAVAEIADGVLDEALSGHVTSGTVGQALGRIDDDVTSRAAPGDAMDLVADSVDASAVASSGATEVAAAVWNALTATYTASGSMGEAQGRLDAAVTTRAAPGASMALTVAERGAVADAVWDEPIADHLGSGSTGEALDDAGATTDPSAIADAVWDESLAGHTGAGSAGQAQNRLDQTISSRAASGDAMDLITDAIDANAVATSGAQEIRDAILSDSTPFAGANVDAAVSSRAVPGDAMDLITDAVDAAALATSAVDEIADQVWEETLADHSGTSGSTAEALDNAQSSVSPAAIADAVWDETLPGSHDSSNSAGEFLQNADALTSSRAAPGAAMDLVSNAVDATALAADAVTEIQSAILSDATPFAGADLDAAVSSRAVAGDDMGLTAAAVDAILDEPLSGHTTLDTVGKALNNVDAQVTTRAAAGDDMGLTTAGAELAADQVWDEALSGHISSGSAGRKLGDLTIPPTVEEVADQVWDEDLSGHATSGSAGEAQSFLDAAVTTRAVPGDEMGLTSGGANAAADQVWEETLADHSGTAGSTAEALAKTDAAEVGAAVWDALLADHDTDATFGAAINACCATAAGASQVTVNIQDLSSTPVQGAQVDIFDSTNVNFLTRHWTDVNGQVVIAIDDGTYSVRIWASGYAFTVPETLTVSGDGSVTYQGQSFLSPSEPSGADKCVIYGIVLDAGGNPIVGAEVEAYAVTPQDEGGYIIGPLIVDTITDTSGYFELELLRELEVNFKIEDADVDVVKTVPDAPSQWYTTWA
jgi:hypothetical protein